DYSSCQATQAAYSLPDFTNQTGLEALYIYDAPDPAAGSIVDAAGTPFPVNTGLYLGRLASTYDRGQKVVIRYDGRGRTTGIAKRPATPGVPAEALPSRYAPRWYTQTQAYDGADRPITESTGSTVTEHLGANGASTVTTTYSGRGFFAGASSSYG